MKHTYSMLVVDDEATARSYVLRQIEWEQLDITTLYEAQNGLEAWQIIQEKHPDLMILDIRMPGMDGVELLEQICQSKTEISVVGLSGYSDFEAARKMLSSGRVVEYLLTVSSGPTMTLFAGLIFGTMPALFHKTVRGEERKAAAWVGFVLSLALSFTLFQVLDEGPKDAFLQPGPGLFLFCGAVWGLSMLLPGLSSSSVLLFLGLYQPMAQGIGHLDLTVLLPMGAGFLLTILLLARLVSWLLERYYVGLTRVLLGFALASTLMILPTSFAGPGALALSCLTFAGGFALAFWMGGKAKS